MTEFLHNFVFGIYPYIAIAVLIVGSIIRYDREPYSWRAGSSQLLRRRQLVIGSVLFHIGVLLVFMGHFVGLLTPIELFDWMGVSHPFKQMVAIVVGGSAGLVGFIGATILIHRRLTDSRIRSTTSFWDMGIILLLWAQLLLGLGTIGASMEHLDGAEMVRFMAWAQAIFKFDFAAASYVEGAHWIYQLHIFLGLTIFLVFPFTRLVHMFSAPVRYVFRSGYQVVRRRAPKGAGK
ncbi:respiratory nitrate reductase subunit gamma [Hyphobacterium marinum]|uniref:Respiratory nitrate reductase subunit gamma n=1 Tax=Hyphobacterium marinum TaxID=3116574 RepID=A0ABU7LU53_9PROT|nr:respiratory nitrate reductase subunit gamma [Hyphobacterium sp. Y6023]MEE2565092.1 respiratory nitrate reductase subunit gamma [Hyphobacterium sp. Y6023]